VLQVELALDLKDFPECQDPKEASEQTAFPVILELRDILDFMGRQVDPVSVKIAAGLFRHN